VKSANVLSIDMSLRVARGDDSEDLSSGTYDTGTAATEGQCELAQIAHTLCDGSTPPDGATVTCLPLSRLAPHTCAICTELLINSSTTQIHLRNPELCFRRFTGELV
jgi:hypothetical protein